MHAWRLAQAHKPLSQRKTFSNKQKLATERNCVMLKRELRAKQLLSRSTDALQSFAFVFFTMRSALSTKLMRRLQMKEVLTSVIMGGGTARLLNQDPQRNK